MQSLLRRGSLILAAFVLSCGGGSTDKPSGPSSPTGPTGPTNPTTPTGPAPVAIVTVSAPAPQVGLGHTLQLSAVTKDSVGGQLTGRTVSWSSSDTTRATVSASGLVTAIALGSATITATSEGKSGTAVLAITALSAAITMGDWTALGPLHIPGTFGREASGKLQALAIFAGNTRIMYAGGGEGTGDQGPWAYSGVFKTGDGGSTWLPVSTGLTDTQVDALWVDSTDANLVLAGTEHGGIFRSTNGGASWTRTGNFIIASDFVSANGAVYAATNSGVVRSTDGGSTWTTVATSGQANARALAAGGSAIIAGFQNGTVMMQASPSAGWQTVSTNAGRNVQSVAIDATTPTVAYAQLGCCPTTLLASANGWSTIAGPSGAEIHTLMVTRTGHVLFAGSGSAAYRSTDGGQSWTQLANVDWDARRIFQVPGEATVIFGTDQGLYRSTDNGATWSSMSGGVQASLLSSVTVKGSTIMTGVQDFSPILSFNGGQTWLQPIVVSGATSPGGEDGQVLINPGDATYCYAYTIAGYKVSSDGCTTFAFQAAAGVLRAVTFPTGAGANILAVDPLAPSNVYAVSTAGVFRSTDFGKTMTATNWPLANPMSIAVAPGGRTILVGTATTLNRSVDGGASWNTVSLGTLQGYVSTIAFYADNPRVVLVGLSRGAGRGGGVARSMDGGSTFTAVNTGLVSTTTPALYGADILSVRINASGLAALAMYNGIYVSADFGDHWQDARRNAVPTWFNDLAWDGGNLYTASYGQGVLRAAVSTPP